MLNIWNGGAEKLTKAIVDQNRGYLLRAREGLAEAVSSYKLITNSQIGMPALRRYAKEWIRANEDEIRSIQEYAVQGGACLELPDELSGFDRHFFSLYEQAGIEGREIGEQEDIKQCLTTALRVAWGEELFKVYGRSIPFMRDSSENYS